MKKKPQNVHYCNPEDCEFCRDSAKLKAAAKRHMDGVRAVFLLQTKPEELSVLFKNCMAHAVRKNSPKTIEAIGKAWAIVIAAFR